MNLVPREVFFTKGHGTHKNELQSFELALRDAGIEKQNLVSVSSILPPSCRIIPKAQGLKKLIPGQVVFCVMSKCTSNEPRRLIVSSVGCAAPRDNNGYGYLSEFHAFGMTEKQAGDHAEDMAAAMLASTLGIDFDEDSSWDEKKEVYRISGHIYKTTEITQSAICSKKGYTTVLAAAVFIM